MCIVISVTENYRSGDKDFFLRKIFFEQQKNLMNPWISIQKFQEKIIYLEL